MKPAAWSAVKDPIRAWVSFLPEHLADGSTEVASEMPGHHGRPVGFAIREVSEIRCQMRADAPPCTRIRLTFSGFAVSDWQNATA